MRVRTCKKPFVDVVVLCSGNKKQTTKQECGIPLSSPSRVIECRGVFLAGFCCGIPLSSPSRVIECCVISAGCSYSLAMH